MRSKPRTSSGIVHRDLKPANIKVLRGRHGQGPGFRAGEGAGQPTGSVAAPTSVASPTLTTPPMTHDGHDPRHGGLHGARAGAGQAGGQARRHLGVWLRALRDAHGPRAFAGEDMADVLTSVLTREPDLTALPASTPQSIRRLIRRCLEKGRDERLRDIGDARIEIRDALAGGDAQQEADTSGPAPHAISRETRLGWRARCFDCGPRRFVDVRPSPDSRGAGNAASISLRRQPWRHSLRRSLPDGLTIAFVAASDGQSRLWLRSLETGSARVVNGTDAAESPFWSPDSQSIGFFAEAKLKRVDVNGGSVRALATAPSGSGGSWNGDGVILFAALGRPISRIPDSGGEPVGLTGLAQQGSNFTPEFLPDGRRFLYYVRGRPEVRGVYIGQLDETLPARRLLESDTGAVYAPSGHLLFIRDGRLMAPTVRMPGRLELSGSAFPVAEGLRARPTRPRFIGLAHRLHRVSNARRRR